MCHINCSGGCPECAPEDHIKISQELANRLREQGIDPDKLKIELITELERLQRDETS